MRAVGPAQGGAGDRDSCIAKSALISLTAQKWLDLAPPAFALASPSPRPGGARVKVGGAIPLVEPELSPARPRTARTILEEWLPIFPQAVISTTYYQLS
jgi:hypothetical protein